MKLKLGLVIVTAGFIQGAWAQSSGSFLQDRTAREALQRIIKANESAKNHMDWHSSGRTPEDFFRLVRSGKRQQLEGDLCQSLKALPMETMTLFENELKNPVNTELLQSCQTELQVKLESYWQAEALKLKRTNRFSATRGGDVQLQTQIQRREVRGGYYALRGDVQPKEVILTFDDGPNPETTPRILDALKAVNAQVIFFHMGSAVYKNPEIVQREAAEGHMIGSHTFDHLCLPSSMTCKRSNGYRLSFDQAVDQIKRAHKAIYDVLGWVAPFFRFPYGEASSELKQFLKQNDTAEFMWNIDSNDWRKQSPESVLQNTLAEVDRQGRGIVLFHDIQRRTAEMLPEFLKELYYRNYNIVLLKPVSETQLQRPVILQQ